MDTIFDNIPLTNLLFVLALIEAAFIYLFLSFRRYMQKHFRHTNTQKRLEGYTAGVYRCDQATSDRIFTKIRAKIEQEDRTKEQPRPRIIVSTALYSDIYFFTEN
jgi:hypothetical protein